MSDIVERLRFESYAMKSAVDDEAVEGTFHHMNWFDKPHRVVYDATKLIDESADEIERLRADLKTAFEESWKARARVSELEAENATLHEALKRSAKAEFYECGGDEETDPVERLRFFCSLAMSNQNWLDVEPFFDALKNHGEEAAKMMSAEPVVWVYKLANGKYGLFSTNKKESEANGFIPLYTSPAIPEGWVMVPKEPTEAMLDHIAGTKWRYLSPSKQAAEVAAYSSMIAAAPKHGEKSNE